MITPDNILVNQLRCVNCCSVDLSLETSSQQITCPACGLSYSKSKGIWNLIKITDPSQDLIQSFWGDLYQQLYKEQDTKIDSERLYFLLGELEKLLKNFQQPIGMEIDLSQLNGKNVIEIGCGSGSHSLLMKRAGANITSVDITFDRVYATQEKFKLIKEGSGIAIAANAERLPFKDNSFDIVYSFGVLHHTTNTDTAIEEVHRILKPKGKCVIMLYSKTSVQYFVSLIKGVLTGSFFRKGPNRLGEITEGNPKFGNVKNPFTRCYTKKQLTQMFSKFENVVIRKSAFSFNQIPKLGTLIEYFLVKNGACELSDGGLLVWDKPLRTMLPIETKLGKFLGYGAQISGIK